MTKIRLWQIQSNDTESIAYRISRVVSALPEMSKGVDLLVLPELWPSGAFNLAGAASDTFTFDSPLVAELSEAARVNKIWLHAGSLPMPDPADVTKNHNTALFFSPDGELVGSYRKQHLFGFADGERRIMNPSDDLVVVESVVGRTGLATCYDLRFPELFRSLVTRGAETLLITSGWPVARVGHWRALLLARAIENQAFVIACNGRGTQGKTTLAGESMVISPRGEVLAHAASDDEFIDVEIDLAEVSEFREQFPVLLDRRIF